MCIKIYLNKIISQFGLYAKWLLWRSVQQIELAVQLIMHIFINKNKKHSPIIINYKLPYEDDIFSLWFSYPNGYDILEDIYSVLLRLTGSDYPFGTFKLFLEHIRCLYLSGTFYSGCWKYKKGDLASSI